MQASVDTEIVFRSGYIFYMSGNLRKMVNETAFPWCREELGGHGIQIVGSNYLGRWLSKSLTLRALQH